MDHNCYPKDIHLSPSKCRKTAFPAGTCMCLIMHTAGELLLLQLIDRSLSNHPLAQEASLFLILCKNQQVSYLVQFSMYTHFELELLVSFAS